MVRVPAQRQLLPVSENVDAVRAYSRLKRMTLRVTYQGKLSLLLSFEFALSKKELLKFLLRENLSLHLIRGEWDLVFLVLVICCRDSLDEPHFKVKFLNNLRGFRVYLRFEGALFGLAL